MKRKYISAIVTLIVLVIVGMTTNFSEIFDSETNNSNSEESSTTRLDCQNDSGDCYSGVIFKIVDGDTIHLVNGDSVRFTLVDSPEMNTDSGVQSKKYLESICPVGTRVFIDEDDGQLQGSYGRVIGMVYCDDSVKSLNQQVIENNHGTIYDEFCEISEFGTEDWAVKHGCPSLRK